MDNKIEIVKFKPEWADGDESEYVVVEDNGDRLLVSPIVWKWAIRPTELVKREMVDTITTGNTLL